MLFFGVLLPMLLGFACTYLGAKRLKRWCGELLGTVVAVVLGFELGVALSGLLHSAMIDYMPDAFDKALWVRVASVSIWTALFGSVWGSARARGSNRK
jgi:hypothetical protein